MFFFFNFSLEEEAESFLRYYYTKWGNFKTFIQHFKWALFKVDEYLTTIWYTNTKSWKVGYKNCLGICPVEE